MRPSKAWFRCTACGKRWYRIVRAEMTPCFKCWSPLKVVQCECGADDPLSARLGHSHLAWCSVARVPLEAPALPQDARTDA